MADIRARKMRGAGELDHRRGQLGVVAGQQAVLAVPDESAMPVCSRATTGSPALRASRAAIPNDSRTAGATYRSARRYSSRMRSRGWAPRSSTCVTEIEPDDVALQPWPQRAVADYHQPQPDAVGQAVQRLPERPRSRAAGACVRRVASP